jgi:hypothetical protein
MAFADEAFIFSMMAASDIWVSAAWAPTIDWATADTDIP